MEEEFSAAGLIPMHLNLTVRSEDELLFLGKATIRNMIVAWEGWLDGYRRGVEDDRQRWSVLQGKSAADIRMLANRYKNPTFSRQDRTTYDDGPEGKLNEPTREVAKRFSPGDTTLNLCGWCHFARSHTERFSYAIKASCNLKEGLSGLRFDTPCFIRNTSDKELANIPRHVADQLAVWDMAMQDTKDKIARLRMLEARAEEKPVLPQCRPHGWFGLRDRVVFYVGEWEGRIIPDYFALGTVEKVERDGGVISVRFDRKVHRTKKGGASLHQPTVLQLWELKYLAGNPTFANVWVGEALKGQDNVDAEALIGAIRTVARMFN